MPGSGTSDARSATSLKATLKEELLQVSKILSRTNEAVVGAKLNT